MKEKTSDTIAGILTGKVDSNSFETESSRRDFLNKTSYIVLGVLAACGIDSGDALTFPIIETSAEAAQGAERSYPLPTADGATIDPDNDVIVARFANRVYAFSLACPHQNTALRWFPRDQRFQCPRHQAKYQPDGTHMSGRPTRNMDRFALRLEDQKVVVDLSRLYHSDREKEDWDTAAIVVG